MDDADDKEREALLPAEQDQPTVPLRRLAALALDGYRQPLDPHKIEDFWWRSDDKISDDAWLADLFAVPNWSLCRTT